METTTMPVAVHKANISLQAGESVREYTKALGDAAQKALKQKLNLMQEADVWPIEVFTDKVVLDVFQPKATDSKQRMRYFGMKYTRKDTGDFEFGETVELKRVTRFEPKNMAAVSKAKKADAEKEDEEKGCGRYKKDMGLSIWAGSWEQTSKSFWGGVL